MRQTEPKGHIVALGLSDELNVFHYEAMQAAAILARYYARGVAPLVLTNTRTSRVATAETFRDALTESSSRMDRDKDVLFVFLTSHGSQQEWKSRPASGEACSTARNSADFCARPTRATRYSSSLHAIMEFLRT